MGHGSLLIGEDREHFPHGAGKVIVISFIHSPTYSFIQEADSDQMLLTWGLEDQWGPVPALGVLAAIASKGHGKAYSAVCLQR